MPYVGRVPSSVPVTADDIPANSIDASKIIDGSIELAEIADGAITDAKIAGMSSSKLSGALPAIDGSSLTSLTSSQMPAGSVVQFVSKNLTSVWNTSSTNYISTDLTIDFTPKFANSTLLVQFFGSTHYEANSHGMGQIRKDGNVISSYSEDDLLAYHADTTARGQLEGGFWAGSAGSTATATYAYYVKSAGNPFYLYRNRGISVTEIKG